MIIDGIKMDNKQLIFLLESQYSDTGELDEAQEEIKSFNQFEYGLTFVPKGQKNIADIKTDNVIHIGKLQQKLVRGGIKLSQIIFSIKQPNFNNYNTIEYDSITKIPISYI